MHWFDEYRAQNRRWWNEVAANLDHEEHQDFSAFKSPDELTPLSTDELKRLCEDFPELSAEARAFLTEFGVGKVRCWDPDQDPDEPWPLIYSVFSREEVLARVESIAEHASRELEELRRIRRRL